MTEASRNADYSLRILWSLARWIEHEKGSGALASIAEAAGVRAEDFDGSTRWVAIEQFETILAAAHELAGSDEAFKRACTYRWSESYGALKYMVWALSPQKICESAAKLSKLVTNVGHFETVKSEPSAFHVRYRSDVEESRLMCLSRQAQWAAGPTMWGLPAAQLKERSCIAKGDACCEYELRWFDRRRLLPIVFGFAGGAISALLLLEADVSVRSVVSSVALPAFGAALGYIHELRRVRDVNLQFAEEQNQVLRDLGAAEAEARTEIAALHQRQRDWIRIVEKQVAERTKTLERVVEGLEGLQKTRVTTLRGFSHDLRNPLFVLKGNTEYLRDRPRAAEDDEVLRDMEEAAGQIEHMLATLMEVATADAGFVKLEPKTIRVAPLADTFRRRLRALVHGRDIKVSVFCTREAPDSIELDPLVFDRIVDNLLTNAAKYTHRGSILLEVSGTPDRDAQNFLTLKLSDTGEGIPPDLVDRIFRPRPPAEATTPQSYGIGLSTVVRLLAQIGGRLDVMSKPGVGTTFWAHFPSRSVSTKRAWPGEEDLERMISRVVTIRRAEAS